MGMGTYNLPDCPVERLGQEEQFELEHAGAADYVSELLNDQLPSVQSELKGLVAKFARAAGRYAPSVLAEVVGDARKEALARVSAQETRVLTSLAERIGRVEAAVKDDHAGEVSDMTLAEVRQALQVVAPDRAKLRDRFIAANNPETPDPLVVAAVERAPRIVQEALGFVLAPGVVIKATNGEADLLEMGRAIRNPGPVRNLKHLRAYEASIRRFFNRSRELITKLDPQECRKKAEEAKTREEALARLQRWQ